MESGQLTQLTDAASGLPARLGGASPRNQKTVSFTRPVEARYKFHQPDKLKITVYDQDGTSQDPRYWDEIGYVETTLGEIVGGQKGSVFRRELQSSKRRKDCGEVTVRAEELRGGLNYNISYIATAAAFAACSDPHFLTIRLAGPLFLYRLCATRFGMAAFRLDKKGTWYKRSRRRELQVHLSAALTGMPSLSSIPLCHDPDLFGKSGMPVDSCSTHDNSATSMVLMVAILPHILDCAQIRSLSFRTRAPATASP